MKLALLIALLLLPGAPLFAQDAYSVSWSTFDGGGGPSSGEGEFTLGGSSLGQMSAGREEDGEFGEFSVTGGYWTFELEPLEVHLTLRLEGGDVILTWDENAPPVILESSADLQLWEPVDPQPAGPPFLESQTDRKFYRLIRAPE